LYGLFQLPLRKTPKNAMKQTEKKSALDFLWVVFKAFQNGFVVVVFCKSLL
jgi:hypothetical protein